MLAWGIIIGLCASYLFGSLGKAFAEWAKKKWFDQ